MGILLPRMNYAHEIIGIHGGPLLPERAPGAKPLVCIDLKSQGKEKIVRISGGSK